MHQSEAPLRPQTQALDALIRETVTALEHSDTQQPAHAMLFLGNWHQAFPSLLVKDPVLEPVDKVVWMVIRLSAQETGTHAPFPDYQAIARFANIRSTSTVSRAIAALRITRWLSQCARVRDAGGRFRGNVYALHDEPLPLADALHLDADYMQFLRESGGHHHARVQAVGLAALSSLDQDIGNGRKVCAPENPVERRIRAAKALRRKNTGRYFGFNAAATRQLCQHGPSDDAEHRDQNSKAVPIYNINNNKNNNILSGQKSKTVPEAADRVYPKRLSANDRDLADRHLAAIPAEHRQVVLDELEGRIRAERQGGKTIYDAVGYLDRLCNAVRKGRFNPHLAREVQQQRIQRRKASEQWQERSRAQPRQRSKPEHVKVHLDELRTVLGMPLSPVPEDEKG